MKKCDGERGKFPGYDNRDTFWGVKGTGRRTSQE